MTSTPQQYRPNRVRPRTIQNRIHWVLGQHGINVDMHTVESIYHSLTSGNDPRPSGVPARFTFQGVTLVWPAGVARRLLHPVERRALNDALALNGNDLLDSEDHADEGRRAYEALWHKTQRPGYVDPTSVTERMNALVQEATEFHGTADDLTDRAQAIIQLDNVLCGHRKPGGRLLCLEDNHHAGVHTNGKHAWNDQEVITIQRVATNKRTVKAQPRRYDQCDDTCTVDCGHCKGAGKPEPVDELNDLLTQLDVLSASL
jgi:hypothetical protein